MPSNRTRRTRVSPFDHHRLAELCEGPSAALLAGAGYLALAKDGTPTAEEQRAIREAMSLDWQMQGSAILSWWVGEVKDVPAGRPWVCSWGPGTRPWAWWAFDAPEPREPGEDEPTFLDRVKLWRPGERARWVEAAHAQ